MKRIIIAGEKSGCGKTTVTCAVLRAFLNMGINAAAFKCGPDYIDPMFHRSVTGVKAYNLDGMFHSADEINYLLYKNAGEISVIEGVMGLYDGGTASAHMLSLATGTPVVTVIDARGMSESLGAVIKGFLTFREPNNIKGFIFNRLPRSLVPMARELCDKYGTRYFGRLAYDKDCVIKSRRLGLITAEEIRDLKQKILALAENAAKNIDLYALLEAAEAEDAAFRAPSIRKITKKPVRIALARDRAFCFYYEETLDLLRELGCEITEFSPLCGAAVPDGARGLIIGGGYPELYAERLSENTSMLNDIYKKIRSGLPTIAECGGFMYLNKSINGLKAVGIIDADAFGTDKLQRFGYVSLTARGDNLLCEKGGTLKAHEFHYWDSTDCGADFTAVRARGGTEYPAAFGTPTLYAGFPHLHLDKKAAERFVRKCGEA